MTVPKVALPTTKVSTGQTEPLLTHEKSLAQKIGQGSEAGDILDQQLAMLGFQLITQLNTLIKTSRIHGRTNAALDKPVETMLTLIQTLAHDQPVTVRIQNDFLFLGQRHLKINAQQMLIASSIIDTMTTWKIGGLTFTSSTSSNDLRELAYLFVTLDPATKSLQDFRQELKALNISTIQLQDRQELALKNETPSDQTLGPDQGAKARQKAKSKVAYGKAANEVGHLTQSARAGGTLNFKQAKRAIQNIVDLMMQDEATVLGLTTLRCHDQYTHNHSVNVSLLSLALANRAGFPKIELADLGLAALFHDMGKASIPLEVLNKPGEFTEDEWTMMRNHPTEGVLSLTQIRGVTSLPARMVAASFEHHMNLDYSGYPRLKTPWKLSLTGRILMIADCYDAMTSSRVYRREPMSPSKVLNIMFSKSGKSFDPTLLKLFVNCVGIVPIGSLVLLDTDELAVVLKPAVNKANAERPLVKVITDRHGAPIENGPELDLTEEDEAGNHRHSIIRLVDTTEYKIDTSRYFV
ncbi:MAG: HD-GYP domain-containing protein [Nitrospira sp.]|nr:HD-GYP domain-containing protein [Nitrospira sp.]MDH4302632.1 HD-GYP domain-containing protein [Nitrospira sp.]MDH5195272.1 HD-GYP domain-containing protein [Nitrospira sp.]